jgi:hypothetical protein
VILFSVLFAVACFLMVVFVDEFHDLCNPWVAVAGFVTGVLAAIVGGVT